MSSGTHWMGAMLALQNKFESSLHLYDNCMGVELGNNIHATLLSHHIDIVNFLLLSRSSQ